ncbi:DUF3574 domain-containing protein [Rubrivivax gelatinosus]|uniref:Uncharacterized protein DUF3574 n=1 Tax=Rubrivivax gelatinosus TaxID=28068 RepID=A0A4R2M6C2_RUBGE|nr:DUF3574 domain-containing protein [Rubrivivax gelatinosus]MBK1690062.1 hypothetical protein [Rubrivivax gelatinosus]TCO99866.1 uncharacterized protein DUF3574 [Rubrivivax gelatinosus]
MKAAALLAATLLAAGTVQARPAAVPSDRQVAASACAGVPGGRVWRRTELYFGRSGPGGPVDDTAFAVFVDRVVTPRFPDGLTLLDGRGQYRESPEAPIGREASTVLVLLHPGGREAGARIEAIRAAYKAEFRQRSVLRVDRAACVSL